MGSRSPFPVLAFLLLALPFVAKPSAAEETSAPPTKPSHALCWRGKPLPECRSFLITEMGVLARLDHASSEPDSRIVVMFDLGWMKNVSRREAIGFSGYALSGDTSRLGLRGRYRRWLSRHTAIDISPGILLSGENSAIDYDPPGFVVGASANLGDLIALTLEAEWSHYRDYGSGLSTSYDTRSEVSWRGGAKLGSALGVAGSAVLFGLLIYIVSTGLLE